jgi:hypothetical protein
MPGQGGPMVPGMPMPPMQPDNIGLMSAAMQQRMPQAIGLIQQGLSMFQTAARLDPRMAPMVQQITKLANFGPSAMPGGGGGFPPPPIGSPASPNNMPPGPTAPMRSPVSGPA